MITLAGSAMLGAVAVLSLVVGKRVTFPPVIFAALWSLLLMWLWLFGDRYHTLRIESVLVFFSAAALFAVGGFLSLCLFRADFRLGPRSRPEIRISQERRRFVAIVIEAVTAIQIALFPIYISQLLIEANRLSGENIVTGLRLTGLMEKTSLSGGLLSLFGYLTFAGTICAFSAASLVSSSRRSKVRLLASVTLPFLYCFPSMSRTAIFFLLSGTAGILMLRYKGSWTRILALVGSLAVVAFVIPALLRGNAPDLNPIDTSRTEQAMQSLTHYLVAPLVAFDLVIEDPTILLTRPDQLSFFTTLAYRLRLTDVPPVSRIAEYVLTPLPTNVYPLYLSWLLDFGYLGFSLATVFLGFSCSVVYLLAKRGHPVPTILFGLVVPGISVSFMGDGFLSSLSIWLQGIALALFLYRIPLKVRLHSPRCSRSEAAV